MATRKTAATAEPTVGVAAKIDAELARFVDDKRFELRIDKKSELIRMAIEQWAAGQGFVRTTASE